MSDEWWVMSDEWWVSERVMSEWESEWVRYCARVLLRYWVTVWLSGWCRSDASGVIHVVVDERSSLRLTRQSADRPSDTHWKDVTVATTHLYLLFRLSWRGMLCCVCFLVGQQYRWWSSVMWWVFMVVYTWITHATEGVGEGWGGIEWVSLLRTTRQQAGCSPAQRVP